MVANSRKTPSTDALRSINDRSISNRAINNRPVNQRPPDYRPLNLPMPVDVTEDHHNRPLSITLTAAPRVSTRRRRTSDNAPRKASGTTYRVVPVVSPVVSVVSIEDVWQVDDEWWREKPISRKYYRVATEDGRHFTIFRDQTSGAWYQQQGGG